MNEQQTYDILANQEVSLIVLDLRIAKSSGAYFLTSLIHEYPQIPILVMTSIDDVEIAVQCMRAGAFNYLVKPVNRSRFGIEVNRALEFWELRHENIRLRESVLEQQIYHPDAFAKIVPAARKCMRFSAISNQSPFLTARTG
jgi:DNA-binding NtrC family response regulator